MKTLVKNAVALGLTPEQFKTLDTRAQLHRRYSSLEFKVTDAKPDQVTVLIAQDKSHAGNYFDTKRLIEIAHETFDDLLGGRRLHVRPVPYQPAPTEVVTADWIKKKALETGKPVKQIAQELGVDAATVSAYKNGLKPLSGVVKAMFYYYFINGDCIGIFYIKECQYTPPGFHQRQDLEILLNRHGPLNVDTLKEALSEDRLVKLIAL